MALALHGPIRSRGKSSIICHYCKKPGHEVAQCYAKHGYPDRWGNPPRKGEVSGGFRPSQRLGGVAGSVRSRGAVGPVQDAAGSTILAVSAVARRQQVGSGWQRLDCCEWGGFPIPFL
ncbi:hypothetical protein LIER_36741 [Lithospermum erythrorhizon]|uniref:Uncharacterized protein n=1 Tax=Lithospermum erythrorhizon TaxID=34254 RepID=A0AAV3PC35_LITER